MVAVAVMVAAWLLQRELDRMYRADLIGGVLIRNPESSCVRYESVTAIGTG
jgi:hypothetical protein